MAAGAGVKQETLRLGVQARLATPGRNAAAGGEGQAAVVGALVLNRFRVRGRLGSGGFGTVYRAWDERLERDVAVKVIELQGQPLDRVLREAQAVARLNHRSVVTLYELGEDGRRAYLVSELVEGATLADLERDAGLSDRDVATAASDLCAALAHAHSRGVVHRDIKPQNVLIAAEDRGAKLMDFGIARVLDGSGITATGDIVGTLAYMAPEQAEGETAGPPADVYSLALTLYEAWSGQNPNARSTPAATARAIGSEVTPLDEQRRDLPLELCETIDACLVSDPELRPELAELEAAIDDALPALDGDGSVPRPRHRGVPLAVVLDTLVGRTPAEVAGAAGTAAATATAMALTPASGPVWAYLLPVAAGLLTLLWSRLGFLISAAALAAWLALPAGRPGAALALSVLAIPPALLVGSGTALSLPVASPLLGIAGIAPVYPALAGLAGRARDRLLLGASGYAWLAVAESGFDRKLLFGPERVAPPGWQQSAGETARHLLAPLLIEPGFWFGIALWSFGALALGLVVRGRSPALDLLGALVWAAALVAALGLRSGAAGLRGGVLAATVLVVIAAIVAWRARESEPEGAFDLGQHPMPEPGREATLS
jgi:hypothetical protein